MNSDLVLISDRSNGSKNLYAYKFGSRSASGVDSAFKRNADSLANEADGIDETEKDLTHRYLVFANKFASLCAEARRLDTADNGAHKRYLSSVLEKSVGTKNQSIWSKWVTIGNEAKSLLPYKDSLPKQRDGLYEFARAKKEGKPVDQWVKDKLITKNSSVRDVKGLRKTKIVKREKAQRNYLATVTLCFPTYDEAAKLLESLLTSADDFKFNANKPFTNALKAKISPADYKKVEGRVL